MGTMRRRSLIASVPFLGLMHGHASAQSTSAPAGARSLTVALGGAFTTVDPHFYHATPNHNVALHMFERLISRDAEGNIVPSLATEWSVLSPTLWEFKLRPNVKFHDGGAFTADDVAFTYSRAPNVPNSPGGFGTFLRGIERVEVVDPLTIRLHTDRPAPNLLSNLAYVGIISRKAGEGAATTDYNSGKAAIGTGPYRFASYTPNDRIVMTRFDGWWGPRQPWSSVTLRLIANPAGRTAAILSGDVDIIDTPSVGDLPRLRGDNRLTVSSIPGVRVMYLVPAVGRADGGTFITDKDGKPLAANPFRDRRVREALSISINRPALANRIMTDTAAPTGQWLPPGAYSYAPDVRPPELDLNRAKQLLAEAGYADGFRIVLHTPNDRYPNDAQLAQAVAQMWTRLGITVSVETLPWSSFSARGVRGEFSMALWGWGSATLEASYLLANCLATHDPSASLGIYNYGRYSNPDLDALIAKTLVEVDSSKRETLLIEAVGKSMADVPVIPMLMLQNLWAVRRGIKLQPRADEYTLAMNAQPE
jgi:peptide/nickel transport system substrate-binding protein